ncbi:hypothetical protein CC1G_15498 [Coprinopsis cinerea okayama7|uniref:Uncharacterized protein n=1 Tax=Coprinopsis cinerea (strain Okayama-7 / 130 / ATCC MYA-4618 / FGSC 9003) TaxID=240176 RepID=D6RN42_COPC7|nr:hypothetical protein CC1G_15498 [Coprinopsis cinerea okayama7\|eukprot:XP_002910957.1 hypothetical protein CC1G_15498 [Coprinopsis cinerea okayama7\
MPHRVDDRSLAVSFQGFWAFEGGDNEFEGTTSRPQRPGARAIFQFQGTSVQIYGTIGRGRRIPGLSFVIDNGPVTFQRYAPTQEVQYAQLFYESPILANETHTLVISSEDESNGIWLDYFDIEGTPVMPAPVSSAETNPSVTVSANTFASSVPGPTQTVTSDGETSSSSDVGWILAGLFGGIALLLLALAIIWYVKRRTGAPDGTSTSSSSRTSRRTRAVLPVYMGSRSVRQDGSVSSTPSSWFHRIENWRSNIRNPSHRREFASLNH